MTILTLVEIFAIILFSVSVKDINFVKTINVLVILSIIPLSYYIAENIFAEKWYVFFIFGIIVFSIKIKDWFEYEFSRRDLIHFISFCVGAYGAYKSTDIINFCIYSCLITFLIFFERIKSIRHFNLNINVFMIQLALLFCFSILFTLSINGFDLSQYTVYNPKLFLFSLILLFCFMLFSLDLFPFLSLFPKETELQQGRGFFAEIFVCIGILFKGLIILKEAVLFLQPRDLKLYYYFVVATIALTFFHKMILIFKFRNDRNIIKPYSKISVLILFVLLFTRSNRINFADIGNYLIIIFIFNQIVLLGFFKYNNFFKTIFEFFLSFSFISLFIFENGPLNFVLQSQYINNLYFLFSILLIALFLFSTIYLIYVNKLDEKTYRSKTLDKCILFFPGVIILFMIFGH